MPKTDELDPRGLMSAVRQGLKAHARVNHELQTLMVEVATNEALATEINEAVRDNDKSRMMELVRKGGLSEDLEITVERLDPDFHCALRVCFFGFCGSCELSW
jgi:hypothetical protein